MPDRQERDARESLLRQAHVRTSTIACRESQAAASASARAAIKPSGWISPRPLEGGAPPRVINAGERRDLAEGPHGRERRVVPKHGRGHINHLDPSKC